LPALSQLLLPFACPVLPLLLRPSIGVCIDRWNLPPCRRSRCQPLLADDEVKKKYRFFVRSRWTQLLSNKDFAAPGYSTKGAGSSSSCGLTITGILVQSRKLKMHAVGGPAPRDCGGSCATFKSSANLRASIRSLLGGIDLTQAQQGDLPSETGENPTR